MGFLGIGSKKNKAVSGGKETQKSVTNKNDADKEITNISSNHNKPSNNKPSNNTSNPPAIGFFSPALPTFPLNHNTLALIAHHISSHCLTTPLFLFSTKDCSQISLSTTLQSIARGDPTYFHSAAQAGIVLRLFFIRHPPLVQWSHYCAFRSLEAESGYPPDGFQSLFMEKLPQDSPQDAAEMLITLFTLLSRVTAYATQNGCSPTKLGTLFGPLLFGFTAQALDSTQDAFVRLQNAAEHLILAFIKSQNSSVPKLQAWVAGYPHVLSHSLGQPSKDIVTRDVVHIRKYVATYSDELWCDALDWNFTDISVLPSSRPTVAASYESRIGHPVRSRATASGTTTAASSHRNSATGSIGRIHSPQAQSLGDWGQFEFEGFGSGQNGQSSGQNGLDLSLELGTASKKAKKEESKVLDWPVFANSEFEFGASDLNDDLKFDPRISASPASPSKERKKLRKNEKELHQSFKFAHPISPQYEGRIKVMEGFIDAYVDLVLSADWLEKPDPLDSARSNWAFVEISRSSASPSISNPDSQWILFEEVIPEEFRTSVLKADQHAPKTGGLFSSWTSSKSLSSASTGLTYNKTASLSAANLHNTLSPLNDPNDPFEGKTTKYVSLSPMSVKLSSASASHLPLRNNVTEIIPPIPTTKPKSSTPTVKTKESIPPIQPMPSMPQMSQMPPIPPLPTKKMIDPTLSKDFQVEKRLSASSSDAEALDEIPRSAASTLPSSPSITRSLRAEMEQKVDPTLLSRNNLQPRPVSTYPAGGIDFSDDSLLNSTVEEPSSKFKHGRNQSVSSEISAAETSEDDHKHYSPALRGDLVGFYSPSLDQALNSPKLKQDKESDTSKVVSSEAVVTEPINSVDYDKYDSQEISYQPRSSMESGSTITPSHANVSTTMATTESIPAQSRIAALVNMYSQIPAASVESQSPPSHSPVGKQPTRGMAGPKLSAGDIALALSMAPIPKPISAAKPLPILAPDLSDMSSKPLIPEEVAPPYQHGMPLAVLAESEEEP